MELHTPVDKASEIHKPLHTKTAAPPSRLVTSIRLVSRLPRHRILSHILFWGGYVVFYTILWGSYEENYDQAIVDTIVRMPVVIGASYLTVYYLVPQLLLKKKYWTFALALVVSAWVFGFLERIILFQTVIPWFIPDYDRETYPVWAFEKILHGIVRIYTVVSFVVAVRLIKRYYQDEQLTQQLAKEKLDAELKFLKAQVHPHFLFNTLNNLYALTLHNSPKSSEVVLELSQFLDYMLYECNAATVPLEKEIRQIQHLINLERIRYGERLEISFTAGGTFSGKRIPPLLMLPFVENAFKHGVSKEINDIWISIDIAAKDDQLLLTVENTKGKEATAQEEDYTKGIGLKNVRRRLDLIYNGSYQLEVFDEEELFMIKLKLPLEEVAESN